MRAASGNYQRRARTLRRTMIAAASLVIVVAISVTSAPRAWALEIKRMTLNNGAILLVSEQHQLPMVTAAIAFDAGSRRDPLGKEGLAALTAASLTEGTSHLTSEQFNQKTDFMGSSVDVSASRDYSEATFTSLKKYRLETLHLLAQTLPGARTAR